MTVVETRMTLLARIPYLMITSVTIRCHLNASREDKGGAGLGLVSKSSAPRRALPLKLAVSKTEPQKAACSSVTVAFLTMPSIGLNQQCEQESASQRQNADAVDDGRKAAGRCGEGYPAPLARAGRDW